MYKLIALDLDGTLLNDNKELTEKTAEALLSLKNRGMKIVFATGRPTKGVTRYVNQLHLHDIDDYLVTYNGAYVINMASNHYLSTTVLTGKDYHRIYEYSQKMGVGIHALTSEGVTTPKDNPYSEIESSVNELPKFIQSPYEIDKDEPIIKIMIVADPPLVDVAEKGIDAPFKQDYTILRSMPYFLEFIHPETNKGIGVEKIAAALDIKPEEVICIGDANNDLHMIEWAGLGVAMSNSTKEAKEIADVVTTSNNDDGIAHFIHHILPSYEVNI